jgi:hypothetical protein
MTVPDGIDQDRAPLCARDHLVLAWMPAGTSRAALAVRAAVPLPDEVKGHHSVDLPHQTAP